MKKLLMFGVALACAILVTGCGKDSNTTKANATSKNVESQKVEPKQSVKRVKKAPPPRKKVSDKEAAKLLLAQMREWMELSGLPKSRVDSKMFDIEMDVRNNENNMSTVVSGLRKGFVDQVLEPCVSENNEVMHIKTPYEKVVLEYAKSRNQVGTDLVQMVFAFRAMSEDEQKEAADKLAKLMK